MTIWEETYSSILNCLQLTQLSKSLLNNDDCGKY